MKLYNVSKIIFLLLGICLFQVGTFAQDGDENEQDKGYEPSLKLSYLKNTDDIRILKSTITAKVDGKWKPIENAELVFYAGTDSLIKLGTLLSDAKGLANLEIGKNIKLPEDENGACTYTVNYEGVENSEANSEELTIVDIQMEMSLEEIDSVKTIVVKATKKGPEGEMVPLAEETVNIYVKRLYSNLKVGEVFLDEEGMGTLEYRLIPGDSIGNITIIARFDEHDDYANVEKRQTINWGTPVSYEVKATPREIWTNVAPTWMTITISIFLLGVWYHLVLVFIRMWKIKKLEKEAQQQ